MYLSWSYVLPVRFFIYQSCLLQKDTPFFKKKQTTIIRSIENNSILSRKAPGLVKLQSYTQVQAEKWVCLRKQVSRHTKNMNYPISEQGDDHRNVKPRTGESLGVTNVSFSRLERRSALRFLFPSQVLNYSNLPFIRNLLVVAECSFYSAICVSSATQNYTYMYILPYAEKKRLNELQEREFLGYP